MKFFAEAEQVQGIHPCARILHAPANRNTHWTWKRGERDLGENTITKPQSDLNANAMKAGNVARYRRQNNKNVLWLLACNWRVQWNQIVSHIQSNGQQTISSTTKTFANIWRLFRRAIEKKPACHSTGHVIFRLKEFQLKWFSWRFRGRDFRDSPEKRLEKCCSRFETGECDLKALFC